MSPAEKQLALFSVLGVVSLAIYCFPILLYITLILAFFYIVLYYHGEESLPARLGLNPRAGAHIQSVLRRWVWAWGVSSGSVPLRGREKLSSSKSRRPAREPEEHCGQRFAHTGLYRQEALTSDSFLFSPRDLLMGSYIARAESPPAGSLRARAPRNPREQLRDNLAKPNYAVYTPNRRLSFTGEPLGPGARFTITPQRHYPLQQQGASSVGVLPPVRWDGFRQKSILSPRNTSVSSPVTVKIARPDCHTASLDHLGSPVFPSAEADPCSRESVLKVLKESRKREVEDEDRSFTAEQRSKRRRNDSGGSAQSAFEPLLPNGTSTQLIPKPGSLKRGLAAASEDMSVKRSRTSSVSSGSGVPALRGTPGSRRNPISSSYSSSQGLGQWKRPLAAASPLSSPGPSRSQTPEGGPKKIREEDMQSPSSVPSVKPKDTSERLPVLDKPTSPPKDPGTSSTEHAPSGGKRRRKIQLVSREDNLSLPPPPELGYSITAKDLDDEKQTAFNKIQKILETPAPEPEPASSSLPSSVCSSNILTSTFASSGSAGTGGGPSVSAGTGARLRISAGTGGSGLSASAGIGGGLSTSAGTGGGGLSVSAGIGGGLSASAGTGGGGLSTSAGTGGGGLSVSAGTGGGLSITTGTSGSTTPSLSSASTAPAQFNILLESLKRKSSPAASSVPATSAATVPASSAQNEPSEVLKTSLPVSTPLVPPATAASEQPPSPGLFSRQPAVTSSSSTATTAAASITTPLLASGFKPIFNPISTPISTTSSSTATESKPPQNFRPIFGTASESSVSAPSSTAPTASLFGGSSSSTSAPLAFTPTTVPSTVSSSTESGVRPEFGGWSAPSTSAQSSSCSVLQFPSALTTSPGANTCSSSQSGVTFGQTSTIQSSTAASFGGFESTATTSQSNFTFGKSSLETSSAQPSFSTMTEPPKPFTFGESSSTPASNSAPFTLGQSAPTTAAPSFGTPAKPTFAFGSSTTAASNFGAATATAAQSSSTFAFGSSAQQPSTSNAPTSTPFKFGAAPGPQFGTPVVNNTALPIGTFTFGAGTTDKSAFGTSNPVFGQNSTPAPIPFGSPGTQGQGFSTVPFGSPATPSFSIGAGSKPSATRQRLQARRQHTRKK